MSTKKFSNIPLKGFRKFLSSQGLNIIKGSRGRGVHEKWSRLDLDRPITLQTHVDPVPEFIVKTSSASLKYGKSMVPQGA